MIPETRASTLRDLLGLRLEPPVAQPPRVVADRDVATAAVLGRQHHLLERRTAVRPVRVHVEVALQVGELDEARQLAVARRLELAPVLAQLRRNPGVAEVRVDAPPRPRPGRSRRSRRLENAVLGDREAAPDGVLPQRDVVVLRAGEVLEQVAVALRRNDAEVEAKAVVGDDRRLRAAPARPPRPPSLARRRRSSARQGRSRSRSGRGPASSRRGGGRSRPPRPARRGRWPRSPRPRGEPRAAPCPAGCGRSPPKPSPGSASDFSTFSSVFAPRPGRARSRSCSAAAGRSSRDSTPSSGQSFRAVLGPRPGTCITSTRPGGSFVPQLGERLQVAGLGELDDLGLDRRRRSRRAGSPCRRSRAAPPERPSPGSEPPRAGRRPAGTRRRRRARACRRGARSARPARRSSAASRPRRR